MKRKQSLFTAVTLTSFGTIKEAKINQQLLDAGMAEQGFKQYLRSAISGKYFLLI